MRHLQAGKVKTIPVNRASSSVLKYADALRLLKQTEEMLEKKKKQIRVKEVKAEMGDWHAEEQEKKLQLREQVKKESQSLKKQLALLRVKEMQKLAQMKKEQQLQRKQNLKKRSLSRLQLMEGKIRSNQQIKKKSIQHNQKIAKLRLQQLLKKKSLREEIYNQRKESRSIYEQFQSSRVSQMRDIQSRQRDDLLKIIENRQRQLEKLQSLSIKSSRLRGKIQKEPSTSDNIRSIDASMRIYNPKSSRMKERKRSQSQYKFVLDSNGTMITEI